MFNLFNTRNIYICNDHRKPRNCHVRRSQFGTIRQIQLEDRKNWKEPFLCGDHTQRVHRIHRIRVLDLKPSNSTVHLVPHPLTPTHFLHKKPEALPIMASASGVILRSLRAV